jgi:hypothetical protein
MPPDPKTDPNLSQEQREFVVDLQSSVETFKRFFTLFLHWRSNSDIWFHEVARTEQLPVMIDQMREIFRAKLEGFLQGSGELRASRRFDRSRSSHHLYLS